MRVEGGPDVGPDVMQIDPQEKSIFSQNAGRVCYCLFFDLRIGSGVAPQGFESRANQKGLWCEGIQRIFLLSVPLQVGNVQKRIQARPRLFLCA